MGSTYRYFQPVRPCLLQFIAYKLLFWLCHLTSWGRSNDALPSTGRRYVVRGTIFSRLDIGSRNETRRNISGRTGSEIVTEYRVMIRIRFWTLFLWSGSVVVALCYVSIKILLHAFSFWAPSWVCFWVVESGTSVMKFSLVNQTMTIFTYK